MTKDEALKMALEALELAQNYVKEEDDWATEETVNIAITAIKEVQAQPEQEPVGVTGIPATGDYAMGYAEGFNDACKPKTQPEQEPVAWMCQEYRAAFMGDLQWFDEVEFVQPPNDPERFRNIAPLYASPPQRQPLTHEQRLDLLTAFEPDKSRWNAESILIDMVEAAHGIGDKT